MMGELSGYQTGDPGSQTPGLVRDCDICKQCLPSSAPPNRAVVDAKLLGQSAWAYLCEDHKSLGHSGPYTCTILANVVG